MYAVLLCTHCFAGSIYYIVPPTTYVGSYVDGRIIISLLYEVGRYLLLAQVLHSPQPYPSPASTTYIFSLDYSVPTCSVQYLAVTSCCAPATTLDTPAIASANAHKVLCMLAAN
jgi:hypothetical protein